MKKYPFTRTISKQNVVCLVFDKVTAEATNTTVVISPVITDAKKLEKAVAENLDNSTTKFIEIVDVTIDEKVYGLTLDAFMSNAVELDPKTRKPIATEPATLEA